MSAPVLVIIAGQPCTGKTTLARRLAADLALPWVGKDSFKELLFDTLGWRDRSWSQQLGAASMQLLFLFAERQIAAGRSCIIESNFRADLATQTLLELQQRYPYLPVQIQCFTAGPVLLERFWRRATSGQRHPGHLDEQSYAELRPRLERGRADVLDIGGALLDVDTTDLDALAYDTILSCVQDALRQASAEGA